MRKPEKHQAKDGTVSYKVRFRHNGKQTSETFRGKGAEAAAKRFAKLLDAVGADDAVRTLEQKQAADATLLDALAEQFFTWKDDRVRSDRTVADYRRDYRTWISPLFGHLPADSLTEVEVQGWVDGMLDGSLPGELAGRKLSPKSIHDRHAILHGIYKWAASPTRRLVIQDPCTGTDLPPRTKGQPKGLRPAEWQALHPALEQASRDGADLAAFLLATGWRFSEAAALSAYAVEDYGQGPVYVTMGQVIRRNAKGEHVIVQSGKSEASEGRRIKLDREASGLVRRRMESVRGDGLVFTNANGKQWHYNNFLNRIWNPAVEAAGLSRRPTPHWLRHTHVAWLVMSGAAGLPEIQRRIGHESIDTTIGVYGKMIDDVSQAALDKFAAFRNQELPKAELTDQ